MYTEEHITTGTSHLSYRCYIGTNKWLIVFHGFGQSADHVHALCVSLQPYYSILSVDLFFHGCSTYTNKHNDAIEIDEWSAILNALLSAHAVERFSIMGFSIGGRFAVSALYAFSKRIDQLILIAPDGIVINKWYRLATSTFIARAIFNYIVLYPRIFLSMSRLLTSLKLTDDRVVKFSEAQMQSEVQRKQVYHSWIYFRKLKMNQQTLIQYIHTHPIVLKIIFGSKDRILKQKSFEKLIQEHDVRIYSVSATHSRLLSELNKEEIIDFLIQE